jgi:hypothetical protein
MKPSDAITLQIGQAVVVEYGSRGSQYARVVGFSRSRTGVQLVRVRKYQKNSGRWTRPIPLSPEQILSFCPVEARVCAWVKPIGVSPLEYIDVSAQVPPLPPVEPRRSSVKGLGALTSRPSRLVNDPDYLAGFNSREELG